MKILSLALGSAVAVGLEFGMRYSGVSLSSTSIPGIDMVPQNLLLLIFGAAVAIGIDITRQKKEELVDKSPAEVVYTPMGFTMDDIAWYDGVRNSKTAMKKILKARGGSAKKETNSGDDEKVEHPIAAYTDCIFVSVKGTVYSVSHDFYGPASPYNAFAGCDASRQLGKVKVNRNEINTSWKSLSKDHLQILDDWDAKFKSKYPVAGWFIPPPDFEEKAEQFEP